MLTIPQIKAVKAEVARMFAEGELLKIEDPDVPPVCGFCADYGIVRDAEIVWDKGPRADLIYFCRGCFEVEGVS